MYCLVLFYDDRSLLKSGLLFYSDRLFRKTKQKPRFLHLSADVISANSHYAANEDCLTKPQRSLVNNLLILALHFKEADMDLLQALLQRSFKAVAALGLALMLAIAPALVFPAVDTANAVPPTRTISADSSGVERRAEATSEKLAGQAQRTFGDAADSPANQVEGGAKEFAGAAKNRAEDLRDQAKDLGRDAQQESETLVDRIKDFFD